MNCRFCAAWRRLQALFRRRPPAAPPAPAPFLTIDHDRMWRGPPGFGPEPGWIARPQRDALRRDLTRYTD